MSDRVRELEAEVERLERDNAELRDQARHFLEMLPMLTEAPFSAAEAVHEHYDRVLVAAGLRRR
jgi:hypothetical protein